MKNKSRISIDDQIGVQLNKQLQYQMRTSGFKPLTKKRSMQLLVKKPQMEKDGDLYINKKTNQLAKKIVQNNRYIKETHPDVESQDYIQNSINDNNRITFSKHSRLNKLSKGYRDHANIRSTYQIKTSMNSSSEQKKQHVLPFGNARAQSQKADEQIFNFFPIKYPTKSQISKQTVLQKVVEDLQQHNRSIMRETKQKVEDFQKNIHEFLQTNGQMELILSEYQAYIQQLQLQRQDALQMQKKREHFLEVVVKQKLKIQREFEHLFALNQTISQQLLSLNLRVKSLEQEIESKQNLIKLLQSSVQQKQQNIKKMTYFNNDICLQLINVKQNGMQTINSSEYNISNNKLESSNDKNYSQVFAGQIQMLQKQNNHLRTTSKELQCVISILLKEDLKIIDYFEKQQRQLMKKRQLILHLQSQKNNKKQQNQPNQPSKSGTIIKNLKSTNFNKNQHYACDNTEYDYFDQSLHNQVEKQSKFKCFQFKKPCKQGNEYQLILHKINNVLKMVCPALQQMQNIESLYDIVKSISQSVQAILNKIIQLSGNPSSKINDINILDLIQYGNEYQQSQKFNNKQDYGPRIQIMQKVNLVKQKLLNLNLSDEQKTKNNEQKGFIDDYDFTRSKENLNQMLNKYSSNSRFAGFQELIK